MYAPVFAPRSLHVERSPFPERLEGLQGSRSARVFAGLQSDTAPRVRQGQGGGREPHSGGRSEVMGSGSMTTPSLDSSLSGGPLPPGNPLHNSPEMCPRSFTCLNVLAHPLLVFSDLWGHAWDTHL